MYYMLCTLKTNIFLPLEYTINTMVNISGYISHTLHSRWYKTYVPTYLI